MKKVRVAAVVAVVMTAATQAREYAQEHPEGAEQALDKVEQLLRGRLSPKHGAYVDKGRRALRQGLGLPSRAAAPGAGWADPDPDTAEPPVSHGFLDPVAPNPSPGTTDDPQPRRWDDDPAPLTPGERPRH